MFSKKSLEYVGFFSNKLWEEYMYCHLGLCGFASQSQLQVSRPPKQASKQNPSFFGKALVLEAQPPPSGHRE